MTASKTDMDRFLAGVEQQAFKMAQLAVKNEDDALDIVQDAMLMLVRRYASRPASEWRPLFFRIVQNGIRDHYRRGAVRRKVVSLVSGWRSTRDEPVELDTLAPGRASDRPDRRAELDASRATMLEALGALPTRQQQVFLLRAVEGMSVAQAATAMGCSEGSVKTHYSRALHRLRALLEVHR